MVSGIGCALHAVGPVEPNCCCSAGHWPWQMSDWPVPAGHSSGPASSTKRNSLFQVAASLERATALKSGSQLAAQPKIAPSPRSPTHASCGGLAIAENDAP